MQLENQQTWDPGRVQDPEERNKLVANVPEHVCPPLSAAMASAADVSEENDMEESSRTELDSHANMPAAGRNACIMSDTGRTANVNPFTPDCDSMLTSIADAAAVWCDCPFDGQMCIFVSHNALLVPLMQNNLMPPFVLTEAGTRASGTPKIQTIEPTKEEHLTHFPETDSRIPLSLLGAFSCFVTSKPTSKQMTEAEDVHILAPSRMSPHATLAPQTRRTCVIEKATCMVQRKDRVQILLSNIQEDVALAASVKQRSQGNRHCP
jgi:hypothetical protein